ncbi:methyl-accepting chemotaxis protein [Sporosarcina beigongshangi]|uniref:methyl-accepting chemotaxis protein n=1 Tax=Sporosarcina beigongshangi TaxID=2782538 RepID=UPI00193A6D38|nr:methyl-accepting chemotaxis protein [Sporosarcina beigongshangi]
MRITVGRKLWIGFTSILVILIVVGASGLWALTKLNEEYRYLIDEKINSVLLFEQLLSNQNEDAKNVHGFIIYKEDSYLEHREEVVTSFKNKLKELDKLIRTPSERELLKAVKEAALSYREINEIAIRDVQEGSLETAAKIAAEAEMYEIVINENIRKLMEIQTNQQLQTEKELQDALALIRILIASLIGIASIVTVTIARLISRSISRPVGTMTVALKQLATGDFAVEPVNVRNKDELGEMADALNDMVGDLRGIIINARQSAAQLATHAEELSASSEESLAASEMVAGITERSLLTNERQASTVKESVISIGEMVTGIDRITVDNEALQSSSTAVSQLVNDGATFMNDFTDQMQSIRTTMEQSTTIISEMATHSEQIRSVTALITGIADQTNLLALNAAIEAARAGEHGKGFSVVADEVRKLAEQSKHSAEEIGRMMDAMIHNVGQAVTSTEDGSQRVQAGLADTEKTAAIFNSIEDAAADMSQKLATVSITIEQIRTMTDKVAHESASIEELAGQSASEAQSSSAATEEQLATTEEISSSAQTLAKLAETLQGDMARFTV